RFPGALSSAGGDDLTNSTAVRPRRSAGERGGRSRERFPGDVVCFPVRRPSGQQVHPLAGVRGRGGNRLVEHAGLRKNYHLVVRFRHETSQGSVVRILPERVRACGDRSSEHGLFKTQTVAGGNVSQTEGGAGNPPSS